MYEHCRLPADVLVINKIKSLTETYARAHTHTYVYTSLCLNMYQLAGLRMRGLPQFAWIRGICRQLGAPLAESASIKCVCMYVVRGTTKGGGAQASAL